MLLTISNIGKEIILNSPVKKLGYEKEEFIETFTNNSSIFYNSLEWGILSAEILKRDKWTCLFCGNKYANYVHHIRGLRYFPQISLHPDFLETICVDCHKHLHRK